MKVLISSTLEYVSKANRSKETCIPTNESQIKSSQVLIFPEDIKGQRVAHIAQVTCFENIVRIRRLIYPNCFFARRVVEMIALPQSVVSLGEAMYQSAFLCLEFGLNSELVTSVAKHKFKKFVKNSASTPIQIFHRQ